MQQRAKAPTQDREFPSEWKNALARERFDLPLPADPVRLVFNARSGPAVNVSLVKLGNRLRMFVNEVDVVPQDRPLPKLPAARAVWVPRPNLKVVATAWISRAYAPAPAEPVAAAITCDGTSRTDSPAADIDGKILESISRFAPLT
jgi:hypothetical protein